MSAARAVVAAVVLLGTGTIAVAQDHEAAERQYRIARRLAAERAGEAEAALRAVIELDPSGPLADDARVDLAVLLGAPASVAELGRISRTARDQTRELLERASVPDADRAAEARLRAALLGLEPLQGRDPSKARLALIAVATDPSAGDFAVVARSTVAWLDAVEGRTDAAGAAWQRVLVDRSDAAAWASAAEGLARVHMRRGRFPAAVETLARRPGVDPVVMEQAVRGALRGVDARTAWSSAEVVSAVRAVPRGAVAVARPPDGSTVVADRRDGAVVRHAAGGAVERWTIDGPGALAVDAYGRTWVAGEDRVARLAPGGALADVRAGRFGSVTAIAVDPDGRVYLLDKRGTRIERLDPEASAPVSWWQASDVRLTGLAWDGTGIVTVDERARSVLLVEADGLRRSVRLDGVDRVSAVAFDRIGQVAIVDGKRDAIVLVGPRGDVRDRVAWSNLGVARPEAIALGPDGSLDILDGASGRIVRVP